jgi:hypothetical protein
MKCSLDSGVQSNDSGGNALYYSCLQAGFPALKALLRSQAGVLTEGCQMSSSFVFLGVKFPHRVYFVRTGAEKIFSFFSRELLPHIARLYASWLGLLASHSWLFADYHSLAQYTHRVVAMGRSPCMLCFVYLPTND